MYIELELNHITWELNCKLNQLVPVDGGNITEGVAGAGSAGTSGVARVAGEGVGDFAPSIIIIQQMKLTFTQHVQKKRGGNKSTNCCTRSRGEFWLCKHQALPMLGFDWRWCRTMSHRRWAPSKGTLVGIGRPGPVASNRKRKARRHCRWCNWGKAQGQWSRWCTQKIAQKQSPRAWSWSWQRQGWRPLGSEPWLWSRNDRVMRLEE